MLKINYSLRSQQCEAVLPFGRRLVTRIGKKITVKENCLNLQTSCIFCFQTLTPISPAKIISKAPAKQQTTTTTKPTTVRTTTITTTIKSVLIIPGQCMFSIRIGLTLTFISFFITTGRNVSLMLTKFLCMMLGSQGSLPSPQPRRRDVNRLIIFTGFRGNDKVYYLDTLE